MHSPGIRYAGSRVSLEHRARMFKRLCSVASDIAYHYCIPAAHSRLGVESYLNLLTAIADVQLKLEAFVAHQHAAEILPGDFSTIDDEHGELILVRYT